MATTYYAEMSYSRRKNKDISVRLKIDEELNISANQSDFTVTIQYMNTGDRIKISDYGAEITVQVNGGDVWYVSGSTRYLENTGGEWCDYPWYATFTRKGHSHTADGGGSFTVTAEITAEEILGIYATKGSIDFSHAYTVIDQTPPVITSHALKSNRFGRETTFYLNAAHPNYEIYGSVTIGGLTYEQATAHSSFEMNYGSVSASSGYSGWSDGSYSIIYSFRFNSSSVSGGWRIDWIYGEITDSKYYDSGKNYPYELKIRALNQKETTVQGVMSVPQKATGITADSSIDIIKGESAQISYAVLPLNAEIPTVTFESSDPNTASVDENGVVTALSDGICTVTVKSDDGGFTAETVINVVDTSRFPTLDYSTRYLSVVDASKIIFACTFLSDELTEYGAAVPELITISLQGKNQPIKTVKRIFEDIESNCNKLRSAAVSAGLNIESIPEIRTVNKQNLDWILIVNGWIDLLNEIHSKINGGG